MACKNPRLYPVGTVNSKTREMQVRRQTQRARLQYRQKPAPQYTRNECKRRGRSGICLSTYVAPRLRPARTEAESPEICLLTQFRRTPVPSPAALRSSPPAPADADGGTGESPFQTIWETDPGQAGGHVDIERAGVRNKRAVLNGRHLLHARPLPCAGK